MLLTCGALDPRDVGDTPGRQLDGIHLAMDYLEGSNRVVAGTLDAPPITAEGKHVIVLGGGDTAADCLGTAHRQGAASVHLIEVMPEPPGGPRRAAQPVADLAGDPADRLGARGGRHPDLRLGRAGVPRQRRRALRAVRVVDVEISTRSFSVTEVPGTERELPADLVLLAIGFGGTEPSPVFEQLGVERNPRGTITADADWQTNVPGVFVAGDMRRGPSLIVWAIAEGRSAAAAVHRYLGSGGSLPAPVTPTSMALAAR